MSMSRKIPIFLFGSLLTASAAAQSGPIVTLDDVLLEREIERLGVLNSLGEFDVELRDSVDVHRRDETSFWVDVPLRRPLGAEFTVRVAIEVVCSHSRLGAFASDVELLSDNAGGWFLEHGPNVEDRVEQGVEEALAGNLFSAVPLDTDCPSIRINDDGSLRLDFAFVGNECAPGQHRHRPCGPSSSGPGLDWSCRNGVWELDTAICEPNQSGGDTQK
jgi:hypothetical protein